MSRLRTLTGLAFAAVLLAGCEGVSLPFQSTPTPAPRTPAPTVAPTPTPTPRAEIEVETVQIALNERAGPLFVTVAFRLRNPNVKEWLYAGQAQGKLTTPDGRPLPEAKPVIAVDLGPGEQKWFAFPAVDTFGSLVGKVNLVVSGGQWLPAGLYPYPGGTPITAKRAAKQRENAPPNVLDYEITNAGELGIRGQVRGFGFDANAKFIGTVECPQQLYPARKVIVVGCGGDTASFEASRLVFTTYADLRPVLVIPTATPTLAPGQTPAPATPAPATPAPATAAPATPAPATASPTPRGSPTSPPVTPSPTSSP